MVCLVSGFVMMNSSAVLAEWFAKGEPAKEAAPAAVPQAVSKKQAVKIQEMVAKRKVDLNGTSWTVEVKPMVGKAKAEKDVISFTDGKVSSKNMEAKGFEPTNFSMRLLEDNETYTWETMQVSEKAGSAFWRGDIGSDGVMRGVLSIRDKKNKTADYNFYSLESNKTAVVEAPVAAAPVAAAPAGTVVAE